MVNAVEPSHVCQQRLSCADIGCGLLPADMLLPCLHRHSESRLPVHILRNSDDSPGHLSFILIECSEVSCVRSAEPHRHSEPL